MRVLVVDDNQAATEELAWLLIEKGFEVGTAASGPAALESLAGGAVDVVLLDLVMPGMGGLEVLKEIRERELPVRVILATEHLGSLDRDRFMNMGADGAIAKPVDRAKLLPLLSAPRVGADHGSRRLGVVSP